MRAVLTEAGHFGSRDQYLALVAVHGCGLSCQ
jgi:hypothetical protein